MCGNTLCSSHDQGVCPCRACDQAVSNASLTAARLPSPNATGISTVDEANPDTAALMRRVVRRTLTVVGGSIAGTAIAWAISSASASAETPCEVSQLDAVPALAQVADSEVGQQVVTPLSNEVCAVGQVVPVTPITDLGYGARRTADEVGRSITGQFGWGPTVP